MKKHYGFLNYPRTKVKYEEASTRTQHYHEFEKTLTKEECSTQSTRCMDCGVPFCQGDTGCPVDNLIPEFNDFIYRDLWDEALDCLHSTNNFPEFTGRLCPAPCESACVLGIIDDPVGIKSIERAIIDYGISQNKIVPQISSQKTGKKIAIVGSGPAGLACAQQLARAGHSPTVHEKEDRLGGLLRYGIPDFKMKKSFIDRRIQQMEAEGVNFLTNTEVGKDVSLEKLLSDYDALVLAMGAEEPIPLNIPGTDYEGVHYAMNYLIETNRIVAGDNPSQKINAEGKNVIVIGGGDTGSDCIGTANRQKAKHIINFRRSEKPPKERPASQPWPLYPDVYYISTSHEEGVDRRFCVSPLEILSEDGKKVSHLKVVHLEKKDGKLVNKENSEEFWEVDLILLAMGYSGPMKNNFFSNFR